MKEVTEEMESMTIDAAEDSDDLFDSSSSYGKFRTSIAELSIVEQSLWITKYMAAKNEGLRRLEV